MLDTFLEGACNKEVYGLCGVPFQQKHSPALPLAGLL